MPDQGAPDGGVGAILVMVYVDTFGQNQAEYAGALYMQKWPLSLVKYGVFAIKIVANARNVGALSNRRMYAGRM